MINQDLGFSVIGDMVNLLVATLRILPPVLLTVLLAEYTRMLMELKRVMK